jgi:aspartyl-tRNA(Asn)/glutamyl-tRNA(Gln) amidotransferase subunit A
MSRDLTFLSIGQLSAEIRAHRLSCVEAVQFALERTQTLDKRLNSYITVLAEPAVNQAKELDVEIARGHYRGPLHGIPISIKDHIDTAGIRTTAGAKSRLGRVPTKDAAVVRRMKAAGAVIMGKANMNKFADGESGDNPDFGRIRNPWNTNFSPGGSSGGSGAQVAAGLVALSIGSDNGGSVRIPASLCGVVGLKPTHGRISMEGIFPRLYSIDHPGPLTRTVEDSAIALQGLAGRDAGDTTTARREVPDYGKDLRLGIRGFRIGVDRKFASVGQAEVLHAFEQALKTLTALGASIIEVTIPSYEQMSLAANTIYACETGVAEGSLYREHPADFDEARPPATTGADIRACLMIPAVDYIRATQQRRVLQIEYARATRDTDVFVAPSYAFYQRPFDSFPKEGNHQFTEDDAFRYPMPFDFLGVPALSVPCGFSKDGFPIGVQFVTRAFNEATVLRAAYAYEQATDWHTRHPIFS